MKHNYFFLTLLLLFFASTKAQNNALSLNGVSTNNYCNNFPKIPSTTFTIEHDFYLNSLANTNFGVNNFSESQSTAFLPIVFSVTTTGQSVLKLGNVPAEEIVPAMPMFNAGQWYHIAIVVTNNATKNLKLYVNGVVSVNYDFTANLQTGTITLGGGATNAKFDNLRIWQTARTTTEIVNNYNQCIANNESGLIGYYNFDGFNGRRVKNLAQNSSLLFVIADNYSYTSGSGCAVIPLYDPIGVTGNYTGTFYYVDQINGKPHYKTDNLDVNCSDNTSEPECTSAPFYYEIVWVNNQWELRYIGCFWHLGEECAPVLTSNNDTTQSINTANSAVPPCTGWSSPDYTFCTTLSNANFELEKNITIYPNPSNGLVNISLQNNLQLQKVNFYNSLGQLVKTATTNVIATSELAKGSYCIEITTNQGKATKQLLIN